MNSAANEHYPLPVFLNISGLKCTVVGGGTVAKRKIRDLLDTGAVITVVAEHPSPSIERLSKQGYIKLLRRRFRPDDLK